MLHYKRPNERLENLAGEIFGERFVPLGVNRPWRSQKA